MKNVHLSISGLSCLLALGLALWEIYFFWFAGQSASGARLGINLAWLVLIYLSFQLISIPFAISTSGVRFIGVLDGLASLVPLAIALIVVFGKSQLLSTSERWEAAIILMVVSCVDLFGGYVFNIALSRRTVDFMGSSPNT